MINLNITSDGYYPLVKESIGGNGGTTILAVSGTKGTSVFTVGYYDGAGNFIAFEGGILDVNKQYPIVNASIPATIQVTGADGSTDVWIAYAQKV